MTEEIPINHVPFKKVGTKKVRFKMTETKNPNQIPKRLFAAQKELDVSLEGTELIGAMRQCLHAQQLFARMESWHAEKDEDLVIVRIEFSLNYGNEKETRLFSFLRQDFSTIQELLDYSWRLYIHGLFGLIPPKGKEPIVAAKIGVARRPEAALLSSIG